MQKQKPCTQCGSCLALCPVFLLSGREEYSPKAKHQLISKGWSDDGDIDWEVMMDVVGHCVCCERCLAPCARRLSVPEELGRARARHPRWQQYFWREWIERGGLLWKTASRLAPLVPNALLPRRLGILHASALAMKPQTEVKPWLRLSPSVPRVLSGQSFVLFGGCTATRLRPRWMEKAARTVARLGGSVQDHQGFACCGGTYEHAGMPDSAHKAARSNIEHWKKLKKPRVVVFCASCLHSLRHYASMDDLLTPQEAEAWLAALTPLSTLLDRSMVEVVSTAPVACAYHSPCHWGKKDEDLALLRDVLPGLCQGESPCCGFGGVLKMLNPDLSKRMAEACWNGIPTSQGRPLPLITGCSGCVMQLTAHAPEHGRVLHWLDVWQVE